MALTIGELVGFINADESGLQQGLTNSQLAMRGLRRDMDGQLRDMSDRFVSEGEAAGMGLADGIRQHAQAAQGPVKKLGLAVGALGVGVPAVAAVTAGLLGLAAGAAAAGIAVKAFTLASGQQWSSVQDVAQLAEEAQKAAASGAADAADKQKAYTDALAQLPPATQDTAKAFVGLKGDFKSWSDGLSGTTMPVFTKGIEILRDLLPMLTPFVKAAATAFSGFLDDVAAGVKSAGFKEWADDMANAAGPALSNFLTTVKNLAVGFGGLLSAFLPASAGMTGGLASLSQSFADWSTSLGDSKGFALFMDLAREGGETLGTLAGAALEVLGALSPLIGVTAQVALWIAEIINKIPPDVLTAIATAFAAIALAVKAYGLYVAFASGATRAWAIAQGLWNTVMMLNPIGLVIGLIVGLVAIIVVAYQESETFRQIVQDVWATLQEWIGAAVEGIMAAIAWFGELPGLVSGWFGEAKQWAVTKFTELITWLAGLALRAVSALASLPGALKARASEAGGQLVSATRQKLTDAITWIKGLPQRAVSALGNLGSVLWNAGSALISGFIDGIKSMFGSVKNTLGDLTGDLTSWKGPEDVDKRILTPAGRLVIGGFQEGIKDQIPALRSQLLNLTRDLPAMALPGSAMPGVGMLSGGLAEAGARQRVQVDVNLHMSGPEEVTKLIRGIVATTGGGSVQLAFGRGSR